MTSFVSFYSENSISPVAQKIDNLKDHFQRRQSLYLLLGISPQHIKSSNFLEFGPGSGHNSLFTASLCPKEYWLVEGNPKGISDTKKILKKYKNCKIINSLFLDFKTSKRFETVWAEGCIPHQENPKKILNHLSSFVIKNGFFITSTASGVSYLSETIRRLAAHLILSEKNQNHSIRSKAEQLLPIFAEHLKNLKYKTRTDKDWIIDNLVHPLNKAKLLSLPEVIKYLKDNFVLYNSLPNFYQEWRWYKELYGKKIKSNKLILQEYYEQNLNFLDFRTKYKRHCKSVGKKTEYLCNKIWLTSCRIIAKNREVEWNNLFTMLDALKKLVKPIFPETAESISFVKIILQKRKITHLQDEKIATWWGRGQQYICMVKRKLD